MQCNNRRGFTIVEIMIAMLVFSVASLMTMAIVIGMSRQYQKGTYTAQLNDSSRTIHQELRDSIAYGSNIVFNIDNTGIDWVCTGQAIYYWQLTQGNNNANGSKNGLYKKVLTSSDSGCAESSATNGANLLPNSGFVSQFAIAQTGLVYNITTRFNAGPLDSFSNTTDYSSCLPTIRGGDFCAIVNYNSSVMPR
jgi:prepilin-type N-terminal cleavage/methylation domain-containing protein